MPRLLTRTNPPVDLSFTRNVDSRQSAGLLRWWPTLGQVGSRLAEQVAGDVGTLAGGMPYAVDPLLGGVLAPAGTDDYVDFASNIGFGQLVGNGSYTLSLWVKATTVGTRQAVIADWNSSGTTESMAIEFRASLQISAENRWAASFSYLDSGVAAVANTWYHIAVTVRLSDLARTIYVDGVARATDTIGGALNNGTHLAVGRGGAFNALYLTGSVADLRIYNRPLPAQEIYQIYAPQSRWTLYRLAKWRTIVAAAAATGSVRRQRLTGGMMDLVGGLRG